MNSVDTFANLRGSLRQSGNLHYQCRGVTYAHSVHISDAEWGDDRQGYS